MLYVLARNVKNNNRYADMLKTGHRSCRILRNVQLDCLCPQVMRMLLTMPYVSFKVHIVNFIVSKPSYKRYGSQELSRLSLDSDACI